MSNTRRSKERQLPANALTYCPDYVQLDTKARDDSKARFREHVMDRRDLLVQCIERPLEEITNPVLALQFHRPPPYEDKHDIVDTAINIMCNTVDKWDGVQFSKQFIAEFQATGKIMDRRRFETISKNHQDQTSWKISGNKFFAPYIARARQYFYDYCQSITNMEQDQRMEVYKLACICYAVTLLSKTIKFHRTKAKPLIRHKTLVRSDGIHVELEHLYSDLKVKNFIAAAKKKRKQSDSKNTIIAKNFHRRLLDCCHTLYREQKQRVYRLCRVAPEADDDHHATHRKTVYPEDLMDSEGDEEDIDEDNTPYESAVPSLHSPPASSTHSNSAQRARRSRTSPRARSSRRDFQSIGHSRDYGVRHDIDSRHRRRQRRVREDHRQSLLNNHNRDRYYARPDELDDDEDDFDVEEKDEQIMDREEDTYHRDAPYNYNRHSDNLMRDALRFDEAVNNEQVSPRSSMHAVNPNNAVIANCVECGSNGNCSCDSSLSFAASMSYPRPPLRRRASIPPSQTYAPLPPALTRFNVDAFMVDDTSTSQTSSEARLCEQLQQENTELIRQRDELWRQMQALQTQLPQMQTLPPVYHRGRAYDAYVGQDGFAHARDVYEYPSQSVPTASMPPNDNVYFNALPPQLQFIQPSMIIRGSSLNGRNRASQSSQTAPNLHSDNVSELDTSLMFAPPFIDSNMDSTAIANLFHPSVDIIGDDVEINDIPSLPN